MSDPRIDSVLLLSAVRASVGELAERAAQRAGWTAQALSGAATLGESKRSAGSPCPLLFWSTDVTSIPPPMLDDRITQSGRILRLVIVLKKGQLFESLQPVVAYFRATGRLRLVDYLDDAELVARALDKVLRTFGQPPPTPRSPYPTQDDQPTSTSEPPLQAQDSAALDSSRNTEQDRKPPVWKKQAAERKSHLRKSRRPLPKRRPRSR